MYHEQLYSVKNNIVENKREVDIGDVYNAQI